MRKTVLLAFALVLVGLNAKAVDFDTRACVSSNSEIFVSGMQRWVRMKDDRSNIATPDKTRYTPTAFALGYQYNTQNWSAGMSVSYETGNVKYDWDDADVYAKVRDETYGATLFGTYRFGNGYYAKGSAFLGYASQKVKSGRDGGNSISSNGSVHSTRFGSSIEFGKVFEFCNSFRVTPHVGFDYAYTPGKDVPYRIGGTSFDASWAAHNTYEIPVAVTLAKDFAVGCDWVLTPSVDATLISSLGKYDSTNKNARPGFASRTGSEWKVYGIGADHWGGRITAGLKAVKSEKFDVDVNYAFEGRKHYTDHRLTASLGFKF